MTNLLGGKVAMLHIREAAERVRAGGRVEFVIVGGGETAAVAWRDAGAKECHMVVRGARADVTNALPGIEQLFRLRQAVRA